MPYRLQHWLENLSEVEHWQILHRKVLLHGQLPNFPQHQPLLYHHSNVFLGILRHIYSSKQNLVLPSLPLKQYFQKQLIQYFVADEFPQHEWPPTILGQSFQNLLYQKSFVLLVCLLGIFLKI